MLYDDIPNPNVFKVFGSLCFAFTLQSHITKLQPKPRKYVFLGYRSGYKGYVLLDMNDKTIFISRNVTFYEHILPYIHVTTSPSSWNYFPSFSTPVISTFDDPPANTSSVIDDSPTPPTNSLNPPL